MNGSETRALLALAWRESRTMRRRLLLYMSSIGLGVGALVAIDSFTANIMGSVHDSSRALLGGDLALTSRRALHGPAATFADSVVRAGGRAARVTTFVSMASAQHTSRTRLAQVRAVSATYPLVGHVATDPVDGWAAFERGDGILVDPSLLAILDAHVGDSLQLGYLRSPIVGTIRTVPGDAGISAAIGPRVFLPERDLQATQLLVLGSRADYKTLITFPPAAPAPTGRWLSRLRPRLGSDIRMQTAADAETNLTNAIQRLSDFLGIVGIVALLLGGIGVASGVTALVARKVDAAAILRCLGATGPQVLAIYVAQAAGMGVIGAAIGAALGVAIQFLLPIAARDFLPIDVSVQIVPRAVALGLLVGLWVAVLFALRPLLSLRRVSPLQALRRDVETTRPARDGRARPDPLVIAVMLALAATLVAISVLRAPSVRIGLATSLGIGGVLAVLWLSADALGRLARRVVRDRWPYVVRQGIANLYRPANQTRSVVLALGFGAFLISTLYLVQSALLREFSTLTQASPANLLFFDVQEDQEKAVDSTIRAAAYTSVARTPIVTMRIAAINGVPVTAAAVRADDTTDGAPDGSSRSGPAARRAREGAGTRRAGWALRREYRSTYRDSLVSSERLSAGKWFGPHAGGDSVAPMSFEDEVARELGVGVGDLVTWDVQGVRVRTRITSLRTVNWARFEPNFFAVFPTGLLEHAPKQYVLMTNVPGADATMRLQRAVSDRYPNVSSVDLSLMRDTANAILRKVTVAIRFLAIFSLAMGIPVLFSAVAATRRERVREGVLLKMLGATRAQVGRIMLAEYAILAVLGSVSGLLLSVAGAWALVHFVFETPFVPAIGPALAIAVVSSSLTIAIGLAGGRDVFSETPLAMLRAE